VPLLSTHATYIDFDFGGSYMTKKLYEIAADIIVAQASLVEMNPDVLAQSLSKVFIELQRMKMAEDGETLLDQGISSEEKPVQVISEMIDPQKSIQEDKVICLECNKEMKQLTAKHLTTHGLSMREYKTKWGFRQSQSLSAKSISRARSKAAKKRGLPEKLMQLQQDKRQEKMEAAITEATSASPDKAKRGRKKKSDR
jgi:predicted transcriptional regulator